MQIGDIQLSAMEVLYLVVTFGSITCIVGYFILYAFGVVK